MSVPYRYQKPPKECVCPKCGRRYPSGGRHCYTLVCPYCGVRLMRPRWER